MEKILEYMLKSENIEQKEERVEAALREWFFIEGLQVTISLFCWGNEGNLMVDCNKLKAKDIMKVKRNIKTILDRFGIMN